MAVQKVIDGTFAGEPIVVSLTEDEEAIAKFRGLAPNSLYQKVKDLQTQVASGDIVLEPDPSCPLLGR